MAIISGNGRVEGSHEDATPPKMEEEEDGAWELEICQFRPHNNLTASNWRPRSGGGN